MGRKERRELERKVKHLAKTKPWELQTLVQDQYSRDILEARINNLHILKSGDKVKLDVKKIMSDPDFAQLKREYRDYVFANANTVLTLRREVKQSGPFLLVSFEEDMEEPRKWFFSGYVKKVHVDEGG